MGLEIAGQIAELIQRDEEFDIREILDPYSLEQRRNIVSIQHKHSSLLFIAVVRKHVSIVTYLLESCGADPNSYGWMDYVKLSCLAMAIDVNSEIIVGILLTHGANTRRTPLLHERAPLVRACGAYRLKIIWLLIEHGANVNSRNSFGETPLTLMRFNLNICKLLVSNGANINSVDNLSQTVLMRSCETEEEGIIYFLLRCENIDVRIRNNYGEDALHLAVRHCSEDIVKAIIWKGGYTKHEFTDVYELESCLSSVEYRIEKARRLWQEALRLRSQPSATPMLENQHPAGKLQKVVHLLNTRDASALLYLESAQGFNNVFTLDVYIRAACKVNDKDKYLTLCEFFLDALHSGEDRVFFNGISQSAHLIHHYMTNIFSSDQLNLAKIFSLFVPFTEEIRLRLEDMTPQEQIPHSNQVENLVELIIEMVCPIDEKQNMNLFHDGIKRILRTGLPGLPEVSNTSL